VRADSDLDDPWEVADVRADHGRVWLVNGLVSLLLGAFLLNYCALTFLASCPGAALDIAGSVFAFFGVTAIVLGVLQRVNARRTF
jgi:hypothetical protein